VLSKSRIFKFLNRDCGTIPVAEITSGKIEIFSKHQRFLIATESSKYLLIFVLYVCVIPGDQKGLFKLAVQLRKFYILVIYNTATGYVLLVYLTNI
jgi:hypothetical protein